MTEKLYDLDSYVTEFTCKVVSLYSDEKYTYVETDRTAFFPEGGGQSSDRGFLGGAYVENVQLEGGKRMSASDFLRGRRVEKGTVFGD